MTKEDFLEGITVLGIAYDKEFTQEQVEVWYSMLGGYTKDQLRTAIKELIKTETYLPTIAHITKQIAKNQTQSLASGEEEWEQVLRTIHRYGSYRQQEALEHMKPYTAYIVNLIGYQNICMSSDNTWNRKEFIAEYEQLKDKEQELLMTGNTNNLKMLTNIKLLGDSNEL